MDKTRTIAADENWVLPNVELDASEAMITPDMMRAGVAALAAWDYDESEPEAAVAAIWLAMSRAKKSQVPPE